MDELPALPRLLDGPDEYHVYLAYSRRHKPTRQYDVVRATLERHLVYQDEDDGCHDDGAGDHDDQMDDEHDAVLSSRSSSSSSSAGVIDNIENGIRLSEKVIFLVSEAYLSDPEERRRSHEIRTAYQKADSRPAVRSLAVILIDVSPDRDLRPYFGSRSLTTIQFEEDPERQETMKRDILGFMAYSTLPAPEMVEVPNMGYTLACCHFHGFLRFMLPALSPEIGRYTQEHVPPGDPEPMSRKMFAVVPMTARCPTNLTELSSEDITVTSCPSLELVVSKGAVIKRKYVTGVYKFQRGDTTYRAVVEYPGVLTTLYDMCHERNRSVLSQTACVQEVQRFYFHLKSLLASHRLENRIKLIYLRGHGQELIGQIFEYIDREIRQELSTEGGEEDIAERTDELTPVVRAESDSPGRASGLPPNLETDSSVLPRVAQDHFRWQSCDSTFIPPEPPRYGILCYPLDAECRGKAYIINNSRFGPTLTPRNNSERDVARMESTLRRLRFEVHVLREQTSHQMKELLADLCSVWTQDSYVEDQALVLCLMSHGKLGQIYGTDEKPVPITYMTSQLARVQSLKHKPKMFFVQACQKGRDERDETKLDRDQADLTPGAPDFFMSYSTLPGSVSYRLPVGDVGSLYVEALCTILEERSRTLPLEAMMRMTTRRVKQRLESDIQLPFYIPTTDRQIWFHK